MNKPKNLKAIVERTAVIDGIIEEIRLKMTSMCSDVRSGHWLPSDNLSVCFDIHLAEPTDNDIIRTLTLKMASLVKLYAPEHYPILQLISEDWNLLFAECSAIIKRFIGPSFRVNISWHVKKELDRQKICTTVPASEYEYIQFFDRELFK